LLPNTSNYPEIPTIESYIEDTSNSEDHLLPDNILDKHFQVLDICTLESVNSMCFTKSYSRYLKGTGSVFCSMKRGELNEKIAEIQKSNDALSLKKALKLRYFSSNEVAKLMSFPPSFSFPESISEKQRYKLLGNSINVLVVSELLKLMVEK
jgi:tRNA (cytosine38-C5)-methyltransferase